MATGFVYFITNPSLRDGLYKIGMTDNLDERIACFNHETSCPTPWKVIATVETEKYKELERHLHHVYAAQRVNPKREFFDFVGDDAVEDVLDMLQECASLIGGIYTVNENAEIEPVDVKKRKLSCKLLGIPAGAKLTFYSELTEEPLDYYVAADQRHIVTDMADVGDKTKWETLSHTAQELLHQPGLWSSCPDNWYYNDKSLSQIRKEMGI